MFIVLPRDSDTVMPISATGGQTSIEPLVGYGLYIVMLLGNDELLNDVFQENIVDVTEALLNDVLNWKSVDRVDELAKEVLKENN